MNARKERKSRAVDGSKEQKSGCDRKRSKVPTELHDDMGVKEKIKRNTVRNRKNKEQPKEPPKKSTRRNQPTSKEKNASNESPTNIGPPVENADSSSGPNIKTPSEEPSPDNRRRALPPIKESKQSESKEQEDKKKPAPKMTENDRKFNMRLAKLFFQQMMEDRKNQKLPETKDDMLETMPVNQNVKISAKAARKHREQTKKLDKELFKPNGDPQWFYPERKASEEVILDDGTKTRYPELMVALHEDNIKMEDGKQWLSMVGDFSDGLLNGGLLKELPEMDPYLPFDVLEERTELYFKTITVQYYTMQNLCGLCQAAIERAEYDMGTADKRRRLMAERNGKQKVEEMEKTAVITSITFDMAKTFSISYDRRRPILSVQKLRKKFLRVSREASREGSREKN